MKNSKKILVIVFAIVVGLFWSCDKSLSDNQIMPEQQISITTSGIDIKNNNGILELKSFEDYNLLLAYISERNDSQKVLWSDSLKFKSYGSSSTGLYDRDGPYSITSWTVNPQKQIIISGNLWEIHEDFIAKINSDGTQMRFETKVDSEQRNNYLNGQTGERIETYNFTKNQIPAVNMLRYNVKEIRSNNFANSANSVSSTSGCYNSLSSAKTTRSYADCQVQGVRRWFDLTYNFSKNIFGTMKGNVVVYNWQANCSYPYSEVSSSATTITVTGSYRKDTGGDIPFYTSGSNTSSINNNIFSVSANSICGLQVFATVVKNGSSYSTSAGF